MKGGRLCRVRQAPGVPTKAVWAGGLDGGDPKTYSDWDGESLSLRVGRVLRPVKK
jgi:hypothetical protein